MYTIKITLGYRTRPIVTEGEGRAGASNKGIDLNSDQEKSLYSIPLGALKYKLWLDSSLGSKAQCTFTLRVN